MDPVKLCGDCDLWKVWPGPRIGIDRYGTCLARGKTTTRVTFCPMIDRGVDEAPKNRPLTKLQKTLWTLHELGLTDEQIAQVVGKTAPRVREMLTKARYKMTGEEPE